MDSDNEPKKKIKFSMFMADKYSAFNWNVCPKCKGPLHHDEDDQRVKCYACGYSRPM